MLSPDNTAHAIVPDESRDAVWAGIARSYAAFGSPLVPSREDIGMV